MERETMRNEEMNEKFELDREFRDFLGEHYKEIPYKAIIDMTWNTNASMFCLILETIKTHPKNMLLGE